MILQPFLLSTLLLVLLSTITDGRDVRGVESCFPEELPRVPDPNFSKDIVKFSLKLFKSLVMKGDGSGQMKNVVISPFSVWSALVIAYLSAEGRTKDEIQRALKLETKIGTYSDWILLQRQLTERRSFRENPSSTTITTNRDENRKARQTVTVIDNSSTSGVQSSSATATKGASESSSSSQSQDESTMTVSIGSKSKVQQCVTDTNGVTRCSTDDKLTRSEDSTATNIEEASSSSSSSMGTSSSSSSSSSTTTCVNDVCETTSTSDVSGAKESETCATDTDGVMVCTKETCTTDASGIETCTTETCTTDATGTETCITGRSAKRTEERTNIRITGRLARNLKEGAVLTKSRIQIPGSITTDVKETATLPKSGTTVNLARKAKETTVLTNNAHTTASKNCSTDSKDVESCNIENCINNKTDNVNCTKEETIKPKNEKKGKSQVSGNSFISKNWAFISQSLRLKACLPSTIPEITPIDFSRTASAARTINAEVWRATEGIIKDLVEAQDLAGAEFLLLNAVHFKDEWMTSFPVENTKTEKFYTVPSPAAPTGTVKMMRVVGKFKYAATTPLNASALLLPYSSSFSLLLLLPERAEMEVERVVERLNFKRLQEAINMIEENEVEVSLPQFSMTSHHSEGLKQALSAVGVSQLFSTPLNLSPLTSASLRLHTIIQQAAIQVNEQGTTFAAATGLLGTRLGPAKVKYNRPFIFLLMDSNHRIPLAAGVHRKPTT